MYRRYKPKGLVYTDYKTCTTLTRKLFTFTDRPSNKTTHDTNYINFKNCFNFKYFQYFKHETFQK